MAMAAMNMDGVRRGVFGGKLSFKKLSAGGRLCTLQENSHFWVPMIKVRPPDGIKNNSETRDVQLLVDTDGLHA
jgi:hypothetical protein